MKEKVLERGQGMRGKNERRKLKIAKGYKDDKTDYMCTHVQTTKLRKSSMCHNGKRPSYSSSAQEMPHVTTSNRRMTNIPIGNGEYVQGIRKNSNNNGPDSGSSVPDFKTGAPTGRPLRYTPGKGNRAGNNKQSLLQSTGV